MISFFDICKNNSYRSSLISSLSGRIPISNLSDYLEMINYVIDNSEIFRVLEMNDSTYDGEKSTDLILPAFTRAFSKVFINPPEIFTGNESGSRLELFKLHFDVDIFSIYLIDMLVRTKGMLKVFDNLDQNVEIITLIVDNYIAGLINNVLDTYDIDTEIVKLKRNKTLKSIIND